MDPDRRIIRDGTVAVRAGEIAYVDSASGAGAAGFKAERVIDATGMVLLPGLIDSHAHGGHGLTKTLGEGGIGPEPEWDVLMERIYFQGSTPDFWETEALLSGLEKLKFGVTTGMSMLGSYPRYDDRDNWKAHVEGMARVGIRDILGIGPPNPPYPKTFRKWNKDGSYNEYSLSHEDSFEKTKEAVAEFNNLYDGTIMAYPTPSGVGSRPPLTIEQQIAQNRAMKEISETYRLPVHSHSYAGDIKFAKKHFPFILGPQLSLAHCTGIDEEEIEILAETGTSVCSGPSTGAYIRARCPVVELIEAGCNVTFCTDASSPDRSFDLFEKMRFGLRLHRLHFHDMRVLSAGKALEMVTIDAAKALGLDDRIGSIEEGKQADFILIDTRKPHLYPMWQEPLRMVYQASGQDVDTVVVNGRILMEKRKVSHLDEDEILDRAQDEALKALKRLGFESAAGLPERFWGATHY